MTRRIGAAVLALLGASALALTAAVPAASAATTSSWATWPTFSGVSGSYQGTMTLGRAARPDRDAHERLARRRERRLGRLELAGGVDPGGCEVRQQS
ncbi:hypothetical protein [Plantibacter sp. Leaf314]|uniref:hypothetical protein n=1 Tax=Plantibacter sp. Leaf314 TaxID=1736333 RepID=UPI001F47C74C|nr:hypothetical protein [Plantibacter sp. Leaf314]